MVYSFMSITSRSWERIFCAGLFVFTFMVFVSVLFFLVEIIFFRKRISNKWQMAKNAIFISYIVVLLRITGLAEMKLSLYTLRIGGYMRNLVPFENICWSQAVANIILFVPLGLLVPIVFTRKRWSLVSIFILSFMATLIIEIIQMSGGRCFDVDDIIMNVLGGIMGYLSLEVWDLTVIRKRCPEIRR